MKRGSLELRKSDKLGSLSFSRSFLWITDPWDKLNHATDTSLRLAQACIDQGAPAYWCDFHSIFATALGVFASIRPLTIKDGALTLGEVLELPISNFRFVLYRTDPPVSDSYLQPLRLLKLVEGKTEFINPIDTLTSGSEKLLGFLKSGLYPETLVSSNLEKLEAFGKQHGSVVMKPLNQARARGVELLLWDSAQRVQSSIAKVESETRSFSIPVLLQKYFPEVKKEGEIRLWFFDSKVIATARKIPAEGEFRFRSREGGKITPHQLSAKEKKVVQAIQTVLKKEKIRMAAVDLILGRVTDFNFTSPGLLVEMEKALGQNFSQKIISGILKKAKSPKPR